MLWSTSRRCPWNQSVATWSCKNYRLSLCNIAVGYRCHWSTCVNLRNVPCVRNKTIVTCVAFNLVLSIVIWHVDVYGDVTWRLWCFVRFAKYASRNGCSHHDPGLDCGSDYVFCECASVVVNVFCKYFGTGNNNIIMKNLHYIDTLYTNKTCRLQ